MDEYLGVIEPHCERITNDIKVSLERVKQELRARHLPFDDTVLKYFLDKINLRIDATYKEFVSDLLFEEKLSSSHSTKRDIVNAVQNARANADDCENGVAESSMASSHQSDQSTFTLHTSFPHQALFNILQATEPMLMDIIEPTNRNTDDKPLPVPAVILAEPECYTTISSTDSSLLTSYVYALTPQESIIQENMTSTISIEQPFRCDKNVVNESEFKQPMTSNQEMENDVINLDDADSVFGDLVNTMSDGGHPNDSLIFRCMKELGNDELVQILTNAVRDVNLFNQINNEQMAASSIQPETEAMEESEVTMHDFVDPGLVNQMTSANETENPTEEQKYSNEQEIKLDTPMTVDDAHFAGKSTSNKRKYVKKNDGLQQNEGQRKKRKHSNQATTENSTSENSTSENSNKKRKLANDSNETKQFPCEFCAKKFTQKNSLEIHSRNHHADKFPFECKICRQVFETAHKLKLHEKDCKLKRYECYICKKFGLTVKFIKTHMHHHTGIKPYPCSQCQKQFTQQVARDTHFNRNHT